MPGTPLKDKLRTAAAAYAPLTALLGASPFRWYDTQLVQKSAFPAIVAQVISDPKSYVFGGRLPTSFARVQFVIWDIDSQRIETVKSTLFDFLDTFVGDGISQSPLVKGNYIVADRDGMEPQTQPPQWKRIIDAKIFNNDSI